MDNKRLNGKLVLSDIPKDLIRVDERTGKKYVYINVDERREVGRYGDTHNITVWTKEKGTVYLGNLKPWEAPNKPAEPSSYDEQPDDLPF